MEKLSNTKLENLFLKYKEKIQFDPKLDRRLVSFQANKKEIFYRWYKYKEGFSKKLVHYFLCKYHPEPGKILDPFAGVGSTLFAARELGWNATGIELLPVGIYVLEARIAAEKIGIKEFERELEKFKTTFKLKQGEFPKIINHISITKGAFSNENENYLNSFLLYCENIKNPNIRKIFYFAAFSILEDISFTRKDGQYLRWDYRAKKSWGKSKFDKGKIYSFLEAINKKLLQIYQDLQHQDNSKDFQKMNPIFYKVLH